MAVNDLALSWKDHHGVLISVFEKLLEKKTLVDCTLAAGGRFLKAHKIVLSACSPYLEALLNQENDKHPIIFLRDVHFEDLQTLVEFVYSGEIKIPEDRLVEFLSVAEALQIKGLGGTESEGPSKKPSSSEPPPSKRRENSSPVPRKRPRRHSSEKEDKRPRERESSPDISVIEPSPPPPPPPPEPVHQHSNETKLRISNIGSVPSPSTSSNSSSSHKAPPPSSTSAEELSPDIRKVKEEVVSNLTGVSVSIRPVPEQVPRDSTSEEILGLKPEFEQVTFTEDYSDDMLPEDDNSEEPVIDQSQPSSSHQYSGFSAEPVDTGGLSVNAPFLVEGGEQQSSEGLCGYVRQQQPLGDPIVNTDFLEASTSKEYPHAEEFIAMAGGTLNKEAEQGKTIQCPFCPKTFKYRSVLRIHLPSHTGEKAHRCPICFTGFMHSWTLARHLRGHKGLRPFVCTTCGKSFIQSWLLKDHMLTHEERAVFSCPICQKQYKHLRNLRHHMRLNHAA